MNRTIKFIELVLRNFKSHKELLLSFTEITRILGKNGAGKSSIGEALTWITHGVDTLGSTLTGTLSPEPTNYAYDRVEGHLILSIDDVPIRLSRMIEKGKMIYYINDNPKTATEYKETVDSLFNKNMFLTLLNPLYFFSQKQDEQRAQLLQYVPQPTNKEVFADLTKLHSDKLAPLLKKDKIADIEKKNKDNKTRKDKEILVLSGSVKTIRDDYKQAPEADAGAVDKLNAELATIDTKLVEAAKSSEAAQASRQRSDRLSAEMDRVKVDINGLAKQFYDLKGAPIADFCDTCRQPLDETSKEATSALRGENMDKIKVEHKRLKEHFLELEAESLTVDIIEHDPNEILHLQDKRYSIIDQIKAANGRAALAAKLAAAEQQEQEARDSHNESVLIIEAVKAFKAAEGDLMAKKIADLFPTLTLELYTENKGDGERKPYFEVYQDGKPFRKLSAAEKVKAGLELVKVLSNQSGIIAPTFIDNAESILKYEVPAGQLIECHVADREFEVAEVVLK